MDIAIIQAGGLGTRMGRHTRNKPKCLVPHLGKTILENNLSHLSRYKVYVIVDHLGDVVRDYLVHVLKRSDVEVFQAAEKSTTSGVREILRDNPDSRAMVVWSDLYLSSDPGMRDTDKVVVGVTDEFRCRWGVRDGRLLKESTTERGVMGIFWFPGFESVAGFDPSLSLVGGNLARLSVPFLADDVRGVVEIGDEEEYDRLVESGSKSRFFNDVRIEDEYVEKRCVDPSYSHLIEDEKRWYAQVGSRVDFVPDLISLDPFRIRRVLGASPHALGLDARDKEIVVRRVCDNLSALHTLGSSPGRMEDYEETYVSKTVSRVESVSPMIPLFRRRHMVINGKPCENPLHESSIDAFRRQVRGLFGGDYSAIHGDPTFSNIVVEKGLKPFFIDPRGRFGGTEIYGDPSYDWAKLLYSVAGNYDSVNKKMLQVRVGESWADVLCSSNGYEHLSELVIEASGEDRERMARLHSLIWLSLTGYVKEDIDSMMFAFYKGVLLWNHPLE